MTNVLLSILLLFSLWSWDELSSHTKHCKKHVSNWFDLKSRELQPRFCFNFQKHSQLSQCGYYKRSGDKEKNLLKNLAFEYIFYSVHGCGTDLIQLFNVNS